MRQFLRFRALTLFVFLFVINYAAMAQSDTSKVILYKIVKVDGREYIGEIISDDGREVLIQTAELGRIYIPKADIASISEAKKDESLIKGKFRESGPFTTRYYFTNNALPIHKGEHYVMVHLYGPEVHFAVADRLSVGIMATWIASPIGLAAKYSIPTNNEKLSFSVGTLLLSSGYLFQSKGYGGLHWGSVTYGQPGKNITFSGGYGYADVGFGARSELLNISDRLYKGPNFSVAGLIPVGDKATFLFDSMTFLTAHHNYFEVYDFNGDGSSFYLWNEGNKVTTVLMPGMRFQSNSRSAFQVALAGVIEFSDIGFDYNTNKPATRSLPVPMCSWFIKL